MAMREAIKPIMYIGPSMLLCARGSTGDELRRTSYNAGEESSKQDQEKKRWKWQMAQDTGYAEQNNYIVRSPISDKRAKFQP